MAEAIACPSRAKIISPEDCSQYPCKKRFKRGFIGELMAA
jgi:hypothetical protein